MKLLIQCILTAGIAQAMLGKMWTQDSQFHQLNIQKVNPSGGIASVGQSEQAQFISQEELFLLSPQLKINRPNRPSHELFFTNASRLQRQSDDWLVSNHDLVLKTSKSVTKASGATINLLSQQGNLFGPVETTLALAPKKSSNHGVTRSRQSSSSDAAKVPAPTVTVRPTKKRSVISKVLAPEIRPLTAGQLNALQSDINSSDADIFDQIDHTQQEVFTANALTQIADQQYDRYQQHAAGLHQQVYQSADGSLPDAASSTTPENALKITADGFYFNASENVNIYTGDIQVVSPDYNLTATKKLKVFLEEVVTESGTETQIKRLIAEGEVFFERVNALGKYERAKAETLQYKVPEGEIYLVNGYPALEKEGEGTMQARKENVWMRLYEDGSLITSPDGAWEIVYTNLKRN